MKRRKLRSMVLDERFDCHTYEWETEFMPTDHDINRLVQEIGRNCIEQELLAPFFAVVTSEGPRHGTVQIFAVPRSLN